MHPRARVLVISLLVLAPIVTACGLRRWMAERNYLGQMIYDYTYARPLEEVWPQAMRVMDAGAAAGVDQSFGKTWTRDRLFSPEGYVTPEIHVRGERLGDGGTQLTIVEVGSDAGTPSPRAFHARNFELELEVMKRLEPEDAERFYAGSLRAGGRAEE